jgi:hypothetical protein
MMYEFTEPFAMDSNRFETALVRRQRRFGKPYNKRSPGTKRMLVPARVVQRNPDPLYTGVGSALEAIRKKPLCGYREQFFLNMVSLLGLEPNRTYHAHHRNAFGEYVRNVFELNSDSTY